MTQLVFNLNAPLVDPKTGVLQAPWNSFFQQFTQAPKEFLDVEYDANSTNYTVKENGTLYVGNGTIINMQLARGNRQLVLSTVVPQLIPVSINDILVVNASVTPGLVFIPR